MTEPGLLPPVTDRACLERFLRQDPEFYVYALGDLDDFFWPYTTWYGWQEGGELTDVVLVYSERYRVAAIGNVVTHPDHRNRGYARLVTARLCRSLLEKVEHVGLHVKADNEAAFACYRELGFEVIASYGEFQVERIER